MNFVFENIPSLHSELFFHIREMYKIYPFIFFLTDTSERPKGRLLAVLTFCIIFPLRFVSSSDFFTDDYN